MSLIEKEKVNECIKQADSRWYDAAFSFQLSKSDSTDQKEDEILNYVDYRQLNKQLYETDIHF